MKQTKKSALIWGFLLFSAFVLRAKVMDYSGSCMEGRWTSSFPNIQQSDGKNIFVYSFPAIELEFIRLNANKIAGVHNGILFIHRKTANDETISRYYYATGYHHDEMSLCDGKYELELSEYPITKWDGPSFKGTVSIIERHLMPSKQADIQTNAWFLPSGKYYFLEKYYFFLEKL